MARETKDQSLQVLKNAIKSGEPDRLYVFHGEETFLLQHYLQQLKKSILDELTESFNFHRFTSETFQLQQFADAVENLPMMAERTMVHLDDVDLFKQPEENREKLAEILADISDYCTVVLTFETVEWKPDKRYKKLFDAVTHGQTITFAKQSERELVNWITRHFVAQKKQISPDLCVYLIELTDGTMTSIASEIRKIIAFSGADTICKADIDAVTEPVLDAVIFRMTDQLSAGDYGTALQTLQKLLKMQQEPILILGSIGSHFRRIATARILLDHGKNASDLQVAYPKITDFAARKAMETARKLSRDFCAKAAELVMETDYKMKTSYDDQQRLLELLILQFAQEARRGQN